MTSKRLFVRVVRSGALFLFIMGFSTGLFGASPSHASACTQYRSPAFDYYPSLDPTVGTAPLSVTATWLQNWSYVYTVPGVPTLSINWGDGTSQVVPSEDCVDHYQDGTPAATYRNWPAQALQHTYSTQGTYTPVLVGTSDTGNSSDNLTPVTVRGPAQKYSLSVTNNGTGGGTVTSQPSGLSCGTTCTAQFTANSTVTLTATPDATSVFVGWGSACSGASPTCSVTLDQAHTVIATFGPKQTTLCQPGTTVSGPSWVAQFSGSNSTADLVSPFRENTQALISALQAAGANVNISATFRPPQRAYLMHYSFVIAKQGFDPRKVPAMAGVNICWTHSNSDGTYNAAASKAAATKMVAGYGITSTVPPALTSRHTEGKAIDMSISWAGTLRIRNRSGSIVSIAGTPRSGMNPQLWSVGASYGVIKFGTEPGGNPQGDVPHWSTDGH